MKRKAETKFAEWRNKPDGERKPLIIQGARQVGKTYFVNELCRKYYADVIYLNFEIDLRLAAEFEENIDPGQLIRKMEVYFKRKIIPESTLIFFDEIQSCERALTSLKYFCEFAPQYHVVAAGSLLGVAVNREKYSFPVGKTDFLSIHPLDFEEYLLARDEGLLADEIKHCFLSNRPLATALHEKALAEYRNYLIVGGMPAAVMAFLNSQDYAVARLQQSQILNSYVADMAKYATPSETAKIVAAYNSIPAQLAKDNRKFQYKVIQRGGSATIFGAALDWLNASGTILQCGRVGHGYLPLAVYRDLSAFKIYMNDVGLLILKSGMPLYAVLDKISNNTFLGAIVENYVAQSLTANGYDVYYWESSGIAELDFVLQKDDQILAIEVKAGEHVRSRSLNRFCENYGVQPGIRLSEKNFGLENNIRSVPLYAAGLI